VVLKMNNRHLIETAVIDISCDHTVTAFDGQSEIDNFVRNDLMNSVDQVFDEISKDGSVYRIPDIEIDLGSIPYHDYPHEMPKRLREQLNSILSEIRHAHRTGQASGSYVIEKESAETEQLYYFLLHGHLPWYSRSSGRVVLELLLEQAINSSPGKFKAFLSGTSQQEIVIERLVSQFSDKAIMHVYRMLSPDHYRALQDYIAELKSLIRPEKLVMLLSAVDSNRVMSLIRQDLITASIGNTREAVDSEQLLVQALSNVFLNKLKIDKRRLASYLNLLMQTYSGLNGMNGIFGNLLDNVSTGTSDHMIAQDLSASIHTGVNAPAIENEHLADINQLSSQLVSALLSGDSSSIQSDWSVLYDEHAQLLDRVLRFYGQQRKVRKHIAAGFSQKMLHDILVLLEPAEYGFVKTVIDHAELFHLEKADNSSDQVKHKAQMWEFSLAYLLVEHGSHFDKKSYLASLFSQMAASGNQSPSVVLTIFKDNITALPESDQLVSKVSQALAELDHDVASDTEKHGSTRVQPAEPYAAYQRLKNSLTAVLDDIGKNETVLLEDINLLESKAQWLLMRLYRELQAGALSWNQGIDKYSIPLLRHFLHALLTMTGQAESMPRSDLVTAIQTNAEKMGNQKAFYIHILGCLFREELIDFDSIGAEATLNDRVYAHSGKAGHATPARDQSVDDVHEQITFEQAKKVVSDKLNGDRYLNGEERAALISSFELVLSRQPSVLIRQLMSDLSDAKFIKRLVELLPGWLHLRFLAQTGIANYAQMLQCAELLNMACYVEEIRIRPGQLERLKWQFIYSYIGITGRLFNEPYFTQYYVDALLTQSGHVDARQFRKVLSRQLQLNTVPSSLHMTQRIIKTLSYNTDDISPLKTAVKTKTFETGQGHDDESAIAEDIYISNAGIVLLAPYLPRLFDMLGLTEDSTFKDRDAAERGVHILQFLVNESLSSPEYLLVLNKLLCGVKTVRPIRRGIELGADEVEQLDGLLLGVIQNWRSLGNTSITGLRESFLQRNGRLQLREGAWHLSVEAKSFDMLLDQIPWSYSTIKFPWIDRVIYVEWR